MFDYEEACPVSKAASVLCERWTLQIIREMLLGASHFSEFRAFLPKISPTLLNTRLKALEQQGIILRKRIPEKRGYEYLLTPCGRSLKPVITEMGKWGMQWVFTSMNPGQLNASALIRDFVVALNTEQLPDGRSTIQITLVDEGSEFRRFLMVKDGGVQVCEDNIGFEVDVYLAAEIDVWGALWYGRISPSHAIEKQLLKAVGGAFYLNNIDRWLGRSQFAESGH